MCNKLFITIISFLLFFSSLKSQDLSIGDNAPPLHIIKWLKGKPVPSFEKGKIYVVEFGYVACPPCRAQIPHLTELSRKYRKDGNVEVISVFTVESDTSNLSDLSYIKRIKALVDNKGDKMDYTIAVDVPSQATRKAWGNSMGFPVFFIVDQNGKIAFTNESLAPFDEVLAAVVTKGTFDHAAYQKVFQQRAETVYLRMEKLREQFLTLKRQGKYAEMVECIDSALVHADDKEIIQELYLKKYEAYIIKKDSVLADECLVEIINKKLCSWEKLAATFQSFVAPWGNSPYFNYERYLAIADSAVKEVQSPYLSALQLSVKAFVMYGYKHNIDDALQELQKALKIVKKTGIKKDIKEIEYHIRRLELEHGRRVKADADWQELVTAKDLPTAEEQFKVVNEKGIVAYQVLADSYMRRKVELAENFWHNYPVDERRNDAWYIYTNAPAQILVRWIGKIPAELETRLNNMEKSLSEDYFKYRPRRNLYYARPFFRAFPKDFNAEENWLRKGNEMAAEILSGINYRTSREEKEAVEWAVFVRDWQIAAFGWRHIPSADQRPSDEINILEKNYWKSIVTQYWQSFSVRLNEHILKYADLPVIADRASDFISGTKNFSSELAIDYWNQLVDKYKYADSVSNNIGIVALRKVAVNQLAIAKMEEKLIPVKMEFKAMDGRLIDLEKYRNKIVLVDFWASWCKPCVQNMPALKALYDKYNEKGLEIIGICLDEEEKRKEVEQIITKNNLHFPQCFEGKGYDRDSLRIKFGIFALPSVWLIGRDGMLLTKDAGAENLESLVLQYIN